MTQGPTLAPCIIPEDANEVEGTCYAIHPVPEGFVGAGATIEALVVLPDGSELTGRTVVPSDFELLVPQSVGPRGCVSEPGELLDLVWTMSEGAWAYLGETRISGLADVLQEMGSEAELDEDPLFLTGLSLSAADTTMMFPSEFGVFDRFDLDHDISVLLQAGLPGGTSAEVTIAAVDRNSVNWVRGGGFNPSGAIRVPSLFGDMGTGVIGSSVRYGFKVWTEQPETGEPLGICTNPDSQ